MKARDEQMSLFEFDADRELIVRLKRGDDLIHSITDLAGSKRIEAGVFTAIGALQRGRLAYYDQEDHEYREARIDSPHEMASCVGNISLKDGKPFVHAHVVLADRTGVAKGGHLSEGIVFAAEVHILPLKGPKLERKYDKATGLSLWEPE